MSGQIDVILADLDNFTEEKLTRLGLEVTAALIESTPVDLGWARASWVPSIGLPDSGLAVDASAAAVGIALGRQAAGISRVIAYRLADGPIWVSNNVPYIERLNEGWSKQAPAGYVQSAILKAVRKVQ